MRSPIVRGIAWGLALLVCLVGMWTSLYLALQHYRKPSEEPGVLSRVCTAFATSSCEKVAKSRWAWFPPKPEKASEQPKAAADQENHADEEGEEHAADGDAKQTHDRDKSDGAEKAKHTPWLHPIPTAELGLVYFSFALTWLVFTGPMLQTRLWPHSVFLCFTLAGAFGSIFYDWVMWTQLDVWCPLCFAAHLGSWLLPVFVLLLWPRRPAEPQDLAVSADPPGPEGGGLFTPLPRPAQRSWSDAARRWPTSRVIITTAVVALLVGLLEHQYVKGFSLQQQTQQAKAGQEYYKKKWMQYERYWVHNFYAWGLMPVVDIPVEGRPMRGSPDAAHTIILFSDFACPACSRFEKYLMEQVMPLKLPGGRAAFKVIFKHWPICKDCNDLMEGNTLHPAACEAAMAAEAARIVGGNEAFWKMHDLLFANQSEWSKSRDFLQYARRIGLDEAAFRKAMDSSEALDRVRADIADGVAAGSEVQSATRRAEIKVDSTPTLFVDGRRLSSPQRAKTWQQIMRTPSPSADSSSPGRRPASRSAGPQETERKP